jgi:signal transduction histidine kinase
MLNGPKLEIPNDLVVTLFRSVRELMYNVIKHARAENITINLMNSDGRMIIEVTDDGIGFGPLKDEDANDETGNFGLFSIKEQLGCFGGKLTINSAVGQGTRAVIECPAK